MEFSRSGVRARAEEYDDEEPLAAVENEQIETLPDAFSEGEFGRRDAEWVVRWYYRRFLGAIPHEERDRAESLFEGNDFEAVLDAVETAVGEADLRRKLDALTGLGGVDLPVATAFLQFVDPDIYLVVDERTWGVLAQKDLLAVPYPDPPSPDEYETYLLTVRALRTDLGIDLWTLYRALWRIWKVEHAAENG